MFILWCYQLLRAFLKTALAIHCTIFRIWMETYFVMSLWYLFFPPWHYTSVRALMNVDDAYLVMNIKQDDCCMSGSFQNRNFLKLQKKRYMLLMHSITTIVVIRLFRWTWAFWILRTYISTTTSSSTNRVALPPPDYHSLYNGCKAASSTNLCTYVLTTIYLCE